MKIRPDWRSAQTVGGGIHVRPSAWTWFCRRAKRGRLPAGHIPLALAFFTAGVEVGHFSFVAAAVLSIAAVRKRFGTLPA